MKHPVGAEELEVSLKSRDGEIPVGILWRTREGMIGFAFDRGYVSMGEGRPVLSAGQVWFDDEARTVRMLLEGPMTAPSRSVHPWFSNLLPEGALREMVERGLPTGNVSDYDVLAHLGEDLPGAVVVRPGNGYRHRSSPVSGKEITPEGIRFSLAGVQMKMSMLKNEERLTFPASGVDGDVIAKLPSTRYPFLPEVEYSSMKLAEVAGVETASCSLVPADSVSLDPDLTEGGSTVLCVDRFDREPGGGRVHIEDFAQVMGVDAERKYAAANEETVMNIATRLGGGGTKPFLEAVRRVACNILMGNTDAHLKNWSLIYRDPGVPSLSPAYDVVAAWVYDRSDSMALKFRNTRNSRIMEAARFLRAAELCGVPSKAVAKVLRTTVERAADEWPSLLPDLPMPEDFARGLLERTHSLALAREHGVTFSPAASLRP